MAEEMPKNAQEAGELVAGWFDKLAEDYFSDETLRAESRDFAERVSKGASGLAVSDALFRALLGVDRKNIAMPFTLAQKSEDLRRPGMPGPQLFFVIHTLIRTGLLEPTKHQIGIFMEAFRSVVAWKGKTARVGREGKPMPADIIPTHTLHFFNITACAISHKLSPEQMREIWAEMSFDERSMLVSLYKKNPAPSNEVLAFFDGELHKILQGSEGSAYRRTAHSLLQDLDEMRGRKIRAPFNPQTFRPLKPPKKQFSG